MATCPYSRAIAAVTADDPRANYMQLEPMQFQPQKQSWIAVSPLAVREVLHNIDFGVRPTDEPIPAALLGTPAQSIFGNLVRMRDGDEHVRLKKAIVQTLAAFDSSLVQQTARAVAQELMPAIPNARQITRFNYALPVCVIAALLGIPAKEWAELVDEILDFSRCIAPGGSAPQVALGIRAVESISARLTNCCGPLWQELQQVSAQLGIEDRVVVANAIGLMLQACESTAGLIGQTLLLMGDNTESVPQRIEQILTEMPSIQNTRRFARQDTQVAGCQVLAGQSVLVLLCAGDESFAFGEGAHRCPGADWAKIIAQCGIQHLLALGVDVQTLNNVRWRVSQNARVPEFFSDRSAL